MVWDDDEDVQDLDSPGAKRRSTANMLGWASNVGKAVSGSTIWSIESVLVEIPRPRP
jgi:hypothetical protein